MNLPAAARALVAATLAKAIRAIDNELSKRDGIQYSGTTQKINTHERYLKMKGTR